jgi:hypothetical protein
MSGHRSPPTSKPDFHLRVRCPMRTPTPTDTPIAAGPITGAPSPLRRLIAHCRGVRPTEGTPLPRIRTDDGRRTGSDHPAAARAHLSRQNGPVCEPPRTCRLDRPHAATGLVPIGPRTFPALVDAAHICCGLWGRTSVSTVGYSRNHRHSLESKTMTLPPDASGWSLLPGYRSTFTAGKWRSNCYRPRRRVEDGSSPNPSA